MRSSSTSLAVPSSPRVLRRTAMRVALLPATVCALVSLSSAAHAHFTLTNPPSWIVENGGGDPQKVNPCGTAAPAATGNGSATNVITTYEAGQEITVEWKETIYHPGHFRIALSADRADFTEPEVQTVSATNNTSVSATIMNPIAAPVLKDGLYAVTATSGALRTFSEKVTLPDAPCEKCTLQVIQFMASHSPGYYYHHCADIKIVPKGTLAAGAGGSGSGGTASTGAAGASMGGRSGVAGSSSAPAAGSGVDEGDDGGCSVAPGAPRRGTRALASLMALGVGAELWRRRSARR